MVRSVVCCPFVSKSNKNMQTVTSSSVQTNAVLWTQCLEELKREVPEVQFNTWVRPLTVLEGSAEFVLCAPNRFIRDFVAERYSTTISQCLASINDHGASVAVRVVTGSDPAGLPEPPRSHDLG